MIKVFNAILVLVLALALITACSSDSQTTQETQESITAHKDFTTYSMEDYFDISYPSDWVPAQSILDELWEETLQNMGAEGLEETSLIFMAGIPESSGSYYPTVNIAIDKLSVDYRTLDEVVAAYDQYDQLNPVPGFHEFSRTEKTVNGRTVIVTDTKDDEPGYGPWRYLQLVAVGEDYAWIVTYACESPDYNKYKDDFENSLESFRIRR